MSEQLIVALVGLVGIALGAALAGLGFLLRRQITGAQAHERVALLNSLADLKAKLVAGGMSLDQVSDLEAFLKEDKGSTSVVALDAIAGTQASTEGGLDDNLPQEYWTTVAMRGRAGARFDVVEAEIAEALAELHMLTRESRRTILEQAQAAWQEFRASEASFAASQYEGGTLAPLIGTLRAIQVSEHRLTELRALVAERKNFQG